MMKNSNSNTTLTLLIILTTLLATSSSLNLIGINYGTQGNNLPPPREVVGLLKRINVGKVRLFEPIPEVLEALRGSGIEVSIGFSNEYLPGMASGAASVASWIANHVEPYAKDIVFKYIVVGDKAIPGSLSSYVLPVIEAFHDEIAARGLSGIKVTTVVPTTALSLSRLPSTAQFTDDTSDDLRLVIRFLSSTGSPMMINVYPYYTYASDPANTRLDYAQFTAGGAVVQDGPLSYTSLFEALVDSFVWAMEKEGLPGVDVVVSESGWPSDGNKPHTTPDLASVYSKGFVSHIESRAGTPKRPGAPICGYLFALFNENLKFSVVDQNFGLFHPDMTPVYPVF